MLKDKLTTKGEPPILLYGITPPKKGVTYEKTAEISDRYIERIKSLPIDGFVIYDIQDESARTSEKRVFDYIETIDPAKYHSEFLSDYDAIIYRAVGKSDESRFAKFLVDANPKTPYIFVGSSSSKEQSLLSLNDAYKLKKRLRDELLIGGICIPERHATKGNEELRVARKTTYGCSFFVTQAVYDLKRAMKFLDDYSKLGVEKKRIIFTFTPCGSPKTLKFMKWLGIYISKDIENMLLSSENMLEKSLNLNLEIFKFLHSFAKARDIEIGANIESVSTRKVEIDASAKLLEKIAYILK